MPSPQPDVALIRRPEVSSYPAEKPFHPDTRYPEYPFQPLSGAPNPIYDMVRSLFRDLRYDAENFGNSTWNPLGHLIRPGTTVTLKPNLVLHWHPLGYDMHAVLTHGSVIRAVLDYVWIALKGEGRIIIGDAPLQSCDFNKVIGLNGLDAVVESFRIMTKHDVTIEDFRREVTVRDGNNLVLQRRLSDEKSYRIVNIGKNSMLQPISKGYKNYRVTNYDVAVMARHHDAETNEYYVASSILEADTVINLPKLKTHRKAGMTGALKNLVGINCHKDCLPHHRFGSREEGFDEYQHRNAAKKLTTLLQERLDVTTSYVGQQLLRYPIGAMRRAARLVEQDHFTEGSWYGNDTIWRTLLDLNRILVYCDKTGTMRDNRQRRTLSLVDAVIAGDHEGPIDPTPKPCGMLIAGENPASVDAAAGTVMGFDITRIPQIMGAFGPMSYPLTDKRTDELRVAYQGVQRTLENLGESLDLEFVPTKGWQGHIERKAVHV